MSTRNVILFFIVIVALILPYAGCQTPPRNATGYTRYVEVYQGDVPDTTGIEGSNVLTVRDAMIYVIGWNVSRIYLHVPEGAVVNYFIDVHSSIANYGQSEYDDWYYWEFPPGTNRNYSYSYLHNNQSVFSEGDFDPLMLDVSGGEIGLHDGVDGGEYTSKATEVTTGINVTGVKVNLNATDKSNISIQASNDNGSTWMSVADDQYEEFATEGADIKYRLSLTGNVTIRPVVKAVEITYNYTPASNSVALMAEYTFTSNDNPPRFEMTKELLYGINPAFVIVYTEEGYEHDLRLDSEGIDWIEHFEADLSVYEREGKELAGVGNVESGGSFTLILKAPGGDGVLNTQNLIYVLMAILIVVGVAFVYKGMKERAKPEERDGSEEVEAEMPDTTAEDKGAVEQDGSTREELLTEKAKTLKAIKKLDRDYEDGVISEDMYTELKQKYKKDAIEILKELDRKGDID